MRCRSYRKHSGAAGGDWGMRGWSASDWKTGDQNQPGADHRTRQEDDGSCGGLASWWWVVFPLVFWVIPSLKRNDWYDAPDAIGAAGRGLLQLSPFTPPAQWLADTSALSFTQSYLLLVAAAVINGAALVYALRMRREK